MKKLISFTLIGLFISGSTYANEVIFACTTNKGKLINVIASGNNYQYTYGNIGKPDLVITAAKNKVAYTPWDGMGSFMANTLTFKNGQYSYEVFSGVDKNSEKKSAGVNVYLKGEYVNSVNCTNKTKIIDNLEI